MKSPVKKRSAKLKSFIPTKEAVAVEKLVYAVTAIIFGLLGVRFIFMVVGADRGNALADFIFSFSRPFVEPFFALFSHGTWVQLNGPRFEFETLRAMGVYVMLAALIATFIRRPIRAKNK